MKKIFKAPGKQQKYQIYNNDNIYKLDGLNLNFYKMDKYSEFTNPMEEANFNMEFFSRNYDLIKFISLSILLFNFLDIFSNSLLSFYTLYKICMIAIVFNTLIILNDISTLKENIKKVRLLFEIELLLYIIEIFKTFNFIPIFILIVVQTTSMFLNMIFGMNPKESLYFYAVESVIIMAFANQQSSNRMFIFNFFINIGNLFFIQVLFFIGFFFYMEAYFLKGGREQWALLDSFKRSYYYFKNIFDQSPIPSIIIPRVRCEKDQIFNKNIVIDELYLKIASNRKKFKTSNIKLNQIKKSNIPSIQKIEYGLKDIIHPLLENQFHKEIQICIKNLTFCFDFPVESDYINPETEMSCSDGILKAHYQGYLSSFKWYKIIVSNTVWNGQDAYSIKFIEKHDIKISQFSNDYLNLINSEFSKVIHLSEKICSFAPELPTEKKEQKTISPGLSSLKSPTFLSRQNINQKNQMLAHNKLDKYVGQKSNFLGTGAYVKPLEESFDMTLLFLMKYQLNYVYDMYLTLHVFNQLKENITITNKYDVNANNLFNYIINNFTLLSKMRRFQIDFHTTVGELNVQYDFLRASIFNMILFILNNSNDVSNKHLVIKLSLERFIARSNAGYYKVSFKFNDSNPIINYNTVKNIFDKFKTCNIYYLDNEVLKLLDIGMITCFYIARSYSSNIDIISNAKETIINFQFIGETKSKGASSSNILGELSTLHKETCPSKYFPKKLPNLIEDEAVSKILSKVFKFKLTKDLGETKQNELDTGNNDIEDTDEEDIDDDQIHKYESVELDKRKYNDYHKEFFTNDFNRKNLQEKEQLTYSKVLKFNTFMKKINDKGIKNIIEVTCIKLDNENLMKNIIYCNPPRILVVEDNKYGRINIRDNINNIKNTDKKSTNLYLDYADDGQEAIDKFKNLYLKGFLFDLILMDINLTQMHGSEATSIIRKIEMSNKGKPVRTKIIAITAEGDFEMDRKLFDNFCKILI